LTRHNPSPVTEEGRPDGVLVRRHVMSRRSAHEYENDCRGGSGDRGAVVVLLCDPAAYLVGSLCGGRPGVCHRTDGRVLDVIPSSDLRLEPSWPRPPSLSLSGLRSRGSASSSSRWKPPRWSLDTPAPAHASGPGRE
jgi:hypothetical protein